jgi:Protein of unknown function (DUF2974)
MGRGGGGSRALCQPCKATICKNLRAEEAKLKKFQSDSIAASSAYDAPGQRKAPPGYKEATPEQLKALNLNQSMLEHPIDPKTNEPSNFRAAVFVSDSNPKDVLIAFKGTSPTSLEDWTNNAQQGLGKDSFYYQQAGRIAQRATASGADVAYTGHSLGGGLASYAARLTGADATTFNSASLSETTLAGIGKPNGGHIDAVSVNGDILTTGNEAVGSPAQGNTRWPLDPPLASGAAVAAAAFFGPGAAAAAATARAAYLHTMGVVDKSLARRASKNAAEIKKNGC